MFGIDPLEEWLISKYNPNYLKLLTPLEIKREIRYILDKQIRGLLNQANQTGPYVELEALFPYRKILEFKLMEIKGWGFLMSIKGGFQMLINENLSFIEKRFTIAHELGHTFLYDQTKEIPTKPNRRTYLGIGDTPVERDYADEIARAILIPKNSIENIIKEKKLVCSTKLSNKLTKLYGVSHDVLSARLVDDLNLFSVYQIKLEL